MKVVVISKDSQKFREFLENQGSVEVIFNFDNLSSNLDTIQNNIIRADKFIVIHDPNSELAQDVRNVMLLLDGTSGLMSVKEFVFIYKKDFKSAKNKQLIAVIHDKVKELTVQNPRWSPPHISAYALDLLDYDSIYRTLMGKSSFTDIKPSVLSKYRQERNNDSKKSFEYHPPTGESFHTMHSSSMSTFIGLKNILAKTDNPALIRDLEDPFPDYSEFKIEGYNQLADSGTKIIIFTGDRLSGSTSHMTALSVSAVASGRSVLILDLSSSVGICDSLIVANSDFKELSDVDLIDSVMAIETNPLCVYENNNKMIFLHLLVYVCSRPNIFHTDYLFVNCDLADLPLALNVFNSAFCSIIFSSLLFPNSLKVLEKLDTKNAKTLVWLNDNIVSPLRQNKYTSEMFKEKIKEINIDWRCLSPVLFEDFEVDSTIFKKLEVVFDGY